MMGVPREPLLISPMGIYISQLQPRLKKQLLSIFSGYKDVVLAACKTDKLSTDLKWELSRGGQDFPHLYRELLITDIEWHRPVKRKNGDYPLPEDINELI